jgi:hypothetical protein
VTGRGVSTALSVGQGVGVGVGPAESSDAEVDLPHPASSRLAINNVQASQTRYQRSHPPVIKAKPTSEDTFLRRFRALDRIDRREADG